jgi:hypothetical protein
MDERQGFQQTPLLRSLTAGPFNMPGRSGFELGMRQENNPDVAFALDFGFELSMHRGPRRRA